MATDYNSELIKDLLSDMEDTVIQERAAMPDNEPILTEAQRLAVREAVFVVMKDVLPDAIKRHAETCPHGKRLTSLVWMGAGVALGSGLAGAGIASVALKAIAR